MRVGRYEVERTLAEHGATQWLLGRLLEPPQIQVVLERVTRAHDAGPYAYRDFLERARLQGRIAHEAVVRILEVGTAADDLLVVHEYLPGWSLEAVLSACARHRHPLPLGFGCAVMADALRGLSAAHRVRFGAPFVHGALDLSNVRVTLEGRGKVKGFARPAAPPPSRYRSPEQLRGEPLVPASDLYAVGLLLREMLTGAPAFGDLPEDAAPEALLSAPLPDLREASPSVPAPLAELAATMVQRARDRRVPSLEEAAEQLEAASAGLRFGAVERAALLEWLGRHASGVTRSPASPVPHVAPPPAPAPASDVELSARRRRSLAPAFGGLFVVGVAASVAAVAWLDPEKFQTLFTAGDPERRPLPAESLVPRPLPKDLLAQQRKAAPRQDPGGRFGAPSPPAGAGSRAARASAMGALTLVTAPEAEVFHRGKRIGKTPLLKISMPAGTQELEFVLPDGHRRRAPVEIREGETSAVRLDLTGAN